MTANLATLEVPEPRAPAAVAVRAKAGRTTVVWLIAAVAVGAILRFWGLGTSRLTYDESFTAMAGRLPFGTLVDYLRVHDSHPLLDYLFHAPFARAGVDEFWFRAPSALVSVAALALFAWWMRSRGRVGVIATAFMAVSTFEVVHGRQARMYAELELLGVGIAMLATNWHSKPRRWHAPALAALVLIGLLTHVSMFLLAVGLFALPGRRVDREAWRWRGAIVLAGFGWALIWGSTFLTQAGGGHSSWIGTTTVTGLESAIGRMITMEPALAVASVIGIVCGGALLWRRRDLDLGRIWWCCFAIPVAVSVVAGLFEPVVVDRTFTLMAWAPCLAIAVLLDTLMRWRRLAGAVAILAVLAFMIPSTLGAIQGPQGPDIVSLHDWRNPATSSRSDQRPRPPSSCGRSASKGRPSFTAFR